MKNEKMKESNKKKIISDIEDIKKIWLNLYDENKAINELRESTTNYPELPSSELYIKL